MPNQYIVQRLSGIQTILKGVHASSGAVGSNTRGNERQAFVQNFLSNVLPPIYRFGTGDATDHSGNLSGQLDVVVEYPFTPSLPSVSGDPVTRLYLAEAIAAVIEVKSDVSAQWQQVQQTASKLAPLRRSFGSIVAFGSSGPLDRIPFFVVGYTGWQTLTAVERAISHNPDVAGILVIDPGIFVSSSSCGGLKATGPVALWGLVCALHQVTRSLMVATANPADYMK